MSRSGLAICMLIAALARPNFLLASDITINSANVDQANNIVMLSLTAELEFSDDAIDALNSGIALIFELEIRITRPRRFLWDPELFQTRRRFALERHALSDQFVLTDLITDERRVHDSLQAAVDDLGRISDLPVVDLSELDGNTQQNFGVRLRLDRESLPAPMIPLAYLSPGWHMSSGWYRWQPDR